MKKRIIILGSTGSIGASTLDVVRAYPDAFSVVGLSSHNSAEKLLQLSDEFSVNSLALTSPEAEHPDVPYRGHEGLIRMLQEVDAEMVVHGISGADGLAFSVASLAHGKDLALANKETVVTAGRLIFDLAEQHGRVIIPVDSEHSALFQLLRHRPRRTVSQVILTASGGPFLRMDADSFRHITPADALRHPTWSMGPKITIDSATLANKGLEVIEAGMFFSLKPDQIKVLIHPESLVHSLVETREGSLYAQVSNTDMKIPLLNAMSYPDIMEACFTPFTLSGKKLTFEEPDCTRFPMLSYAYEALARGGSYMIAYNAVNETAVDAFLDGRIPFIGIAELTSRMLAKDWSKAPADFQEVYDISRRVGELASREVTRL